MRAKVFKTLDEQIQILKEKGLVIEDYEETKELLLRENYFFISGYRHMFLCQNKPKRFIEGTTFDELYAVFTFDRALRNIMFKNILIVENNIKSIMSYRLSKQYGSKEKDYLDIKNFTPDVLKERQVHDILNKMKRQIRINSKQHSATMHYINHYGYIPLWILVKVLSFGIIAELYSVLKDEDQQDIAQFYKTTPESLIVYLSILSNFRNLCAHEDILYNHRTQKVIPDTKYHKVLHIEKQDDMYIYGKNDLFAVLIILRQMLTNEQFIDMIGEISYEIDLLDGKVDTVPLTSILSCIGFPENWRNIDDIE
ncbi:MAG: Abi family protein [Bacilli bacterium]|nr:Abi family protein [Bacilli bacterium]